MKLDDLQEIRRDRDYCHEILDGFVPRENNQGEVYRLFERLQILMAAAEFTAERDDRGCLSVQVRQYLASPTCWTKDALIKGTTGES